MSEQDQETKETTAKNPIKEQPVAAEKPKRTLPKLSTGWWVLVVAFAFFALLGLFAVGSAAIHMASNNTTTRAANGFHGVRGMMVRNNDVGFRTGDMMGDRVDFDDRDSSSTTSVSGVVTAVDGSTITVAGNGTTTKVVVNDSTTYIGDDKPAVVNDTIMAIGTKSSDTFTAIRVVLQRQ